MSKNEETFWKKGFICLLLLSCLSFSILGGYNLLKIQRLEWRINAEYFDAAILQRELVVENGYHDGKVTCVKFADDGKACRGGMTFDFGLYRPNGEEVPLTGFIHATTNVV
ncbi:MAG: hypothetical protein KKB31_03585, partial [Nanoarchaeota archaeon]|nr:hypothetical protein [Nanoarchaeota archaeon]